MATNILGAFLIQVMWQLCDGRKRSFSRQLSHAVAIVIVVDASPSSSGSDVTLTSASMICFNLRDEHRFVSTSRE